MFWSNSSQWKSWLQTLSFSLFLRKVIPVCHPLMYVSWYGCCPTSSSLFPHFCICTEAVFNVWGAPQRWTLQTLKTSNFKCLNKPEDDKLTSCECDNEKVCDNEQEIPSHIPQFFNFFPILSSIYLPQPSAPILLSSLYISVSLLPSHLPHSIYHFLPPSLSSLLYSPSFFLLIPPSLCSALSAGYIGAN